MFVSFTKTLKKMSGFRLGFGVRVNKRNAPLWCFAIFPSVFHFFRRYVVIAAACPCPSDPARRSREREVCRAKGSAVFALQRVGNDLLVSHIAGDPDTSAVQLRTSVSCPVGAIPIDFKRRAVVKFPRRRSAAYCNAAKPFAFKAGNRELSANWRYIVPMVFPDELAGGL